MALASSASVTDNYGNAYGIDTRFPERISGIGIVSHDGANPSFQLAPGASRSASLVFSRSPGKSAVGNLYTADFSVVELQPIPGNNQLNVGSQYSLNYTKLSAGGLLGSNAMSNGAEKVNDITQGITTLLNAFSKKQH